MKNDKMLFNQENKNEVVETTEEKILEMNELENVSGGKKTGYPPIDYHTWAKRNDHPIPDEYPVYR